MNSYYFLVALLCLVNINAEKMSYKVEVVPNAHTNLGEGPHWDIDSQSLYFVDLDQGSLLRYDLNENKTYRAKIEGETFAGFVIPVEGQKHKFAVGCDRRVVIVHWDGVSSTAKVEKTVFTVQPEQKFALNRFNDGKCDSQGRLYAGTMLSTSDCFTQRLGAFFFLPSIGKEQTLRTDVAISNGLTWNYKTNKFYYIDTCDHEVKEYEYDPVSGAISNPKVLVDLHAPNDENLVYPDGMTIDSEGNLYVALYEGSGVYQVAPNGKILQKIETPCKHITSVAFGGPNFDILFVTSSARDDDAEMAGQTFKVTGLGKKGLPMHNMKI